jgi:hypothetical protein
MNGKGVYDPILTEVRRNKARLIEMYGGIDGWLKHLDEDRCRLEKEGWHFLTEEEMEALKHRHDKVEA